MRIHEKRRAIVPGSFDPITVGHEDLIRRALKMFDEVYVVAMVNPEKHYRFSPEEKLRLMKAACRDLPHVICDYDEGLLVAYAASHGIGTIVKGARTEADFLYEKRMAEINRSMAPEIETVILPAKEELSHISSTAVRRAMDEGRDFSILLSPPVSEELSRIKSPQK